MFLFYPFFFVSFFLQACRLSQKYWKDQGATPNPTTPEPLPNNPQYISSWGRSEPDDHDHEDGIVGPLPCEIPRINAPLPCGAGLGPIQSTGEGPDHTRVGCQPECPMVFKARLPPTARLSSNCLHFHSVLESGPKRERKKQ